MIVDILNLASCFAFILDLVLSSSHSSLEHSNASHGGGIFSLLHVSAAATAETS